MVGGSEIEVEREGGREAKKGRERERDEGEGR
jgi:hypothetical protein